MNRILMMQNEGEMSDGVVVRQMDQKPATAPGSSHDSISSYVARRSMDSATFSVDPSSRAR
jgi:hypothetical protein